MLAYCNTLKQLRKLRLRSEGQNDHGHDVQCPLVTGLVVIPRKLPDINLIEAESLLGIVGEGLESTPVNQNAVTVSGRPFRVLESIRGFRRQIRAQIETAKLGCHCEATSVVETSLSRPTLNMDNNGTPALPGPSKKSSGHNSSFSGRLDKNDTPPRSSTKDSSGQSTSSYETPVSSSSSHSSFSGGTDKNGATANFNCFVRLEQIPENTVPATKRTDPRPGPVIKCTGGPIIFIDLEAEENVNDLEYPDCSSSNNAELSNSKNQRMSQNRRIIVDSLHKELNDSLSLTAEQPSLVPSKDYDIQVITLSDDDEEEEWNPGVKHKESKSLLLEDYEEEDQEQQNEAVAELDTIAETTCSLILIPPSTEKAGGQEEEEFNGCGKYRKSLSLLEEDIEEGQDEEVQGVEFEDTDEDEATSSSILSLPSQENGTDQEEEVTEQSSSTSSPCAYDIGALKVAMATELFWQRKEGRYFVLAGQIYKPPAANSPEIRDPFSAPGFNFDAYLRHHVNKMKEFNAARDRVTEE